MGVAVECVRLAGAPDVERLFLVPGLGGQALPFIALARAVGHVCAIHGFQLAAVPASAAGGGRPGLVQQYAAALRASGPPPYRLAGYCSGAYLACAIAQELGAAALAGPVLALVQSSEGPVRDAAGSTALATRLRAARRAFARARDRDGGEPGASDGPASSPPSPVSMLSMLGIAPRTPARYAAGLIDVMLAQSDAIAGCQPYSFSVPVSLVVGAETDDEAVRAERHWRAIVTHDLEVRCVRAEAGQDWLRAVAGLIAERMRPGP